MAGSEGTGCSSGRPRFDSRDPHGGSRLSQGIGTRHKHKRKLHADKQTHLNWCNLCRNAQPCLLDLAPQPHPKKVPVSLICSVNPLICPEEEDISLLTMPS